MKIFILLVVIFLLFNYTELKLNIENFEKNRDTKKVIFKANLCLYLFGIIKILNIDLRRDGMHFLLLKNKNRKIDKNKVTPKMMKVFFKDLNWKIEKMNFFLSIGIDNVEVTVFLVSLIAMFISILSGEYKEKININNYNYSVIPIYNKNTIEFKISTIFSAKISNIIKVFLILNKLKKSKINNNSNQLKHC